jgi:hypothetical protein
MSESNETHFDIKRITAANWQHLDKTTMLLLKMTAIAKTDKEWVEAFLCPTLNPAVPKEVAKLLEVARGAMIYGWHFYPLSTLGAEQCWRVMEAGVRVRCQQVGIPTVRTVQKGKLKGQAKENSFGENIEVLVRHGKISEPDQSRWKAVKDLRNSTSHPERKMILDSWQALGILHNSVDFLNDLFQ